jgi:hypothetical protein
MPDEVDDPSASGKLISQKDLDRILRKRLKRQEEQLAKRYADYDQRVEEAKTFRKLLDERATEAERWAEERNQLIASLQEKDDQLSKLERLNLVAHLATDAKLPKSLWKRVHGDTEEDIAEDIASIIHDLGLDVDRVIREAVNESKPSTLV